MDAAAKHLLVFGAVLLALPYLAQARFDGNVSPGTAGLGGLTLSQARVRALEGNPRLRAAGAEVHAADGALRQAKAILNPQLEATAEDVGGDLPHWGQSQTTFSVSQPLEVPGKRKARAEAARFLKEAARQDFLRLRLDLLAEVDRRFATLLGAQERKLVAAENLDTAREVSAAVAALVEAGEASPIEALRARSDEGLAQIDLRGAERELDLARRELALLMGQQDPAFARAEGQLEEEVPVPDEGTALAGLSSLPDMARWRAEASRSEADLRLARRSRWPDLSLSAGWRRYAATGGHAYVAGLALSLPVFNTGAGAVIESSARLDQANLLSRAEEIRLESGLRSAREVLLKASEESRDLRDRVVPSALQIYEALNEGYRRGKFRLLDLLEARRSLAAAKLQYLDALVRLNAAKADLERLLGTHLTAVNGDLP